MGFNLSEYCLLYLYECDLQLFFSKRNEQRPSSRLSMLTNFTLLDLYFTFYHLVLTLINFRMFLADPEGEDPLSRGEDLERVVLTGVQLFFHVEDATILPLLVLVNCQRNSDSSPSS